MTENGLKHAENRRLTLVGTEGVPDRTMEHSGEEAVGAEPRRHDAARSRLKEKLGTAGLCAGLILVLEGPAVVFAGSGA